MSVGASPIAAARALIWANSVALSVVVSMVGGAGTEVGTLGSVVPPGKVTLGMVGSVGVGGGAGGSVAARTGVTAAATANTAPTTMNFLNRDMRLPPLVKGRPVTG